MWTTYNQQQREDKITLLKAEIIKLRELWDKDALRKRQGYKRLLCHKWGIKW